MNAVEGILYTILAIVILLSLGTGFLVLADPIAKALKHRRGKKSKEAKA